MDRAVAQRKYDRLNARNNEIKTQIKPLQSEFSKNENEIKKAKEALKEFERIDSLRPRISDHAVIRYLERKCGYSFEEVRQKLMTEAVMAAIVSGAKTVKHDNMKLVISDKCVVTIV